MITAAVANALPNLTAALRTQITNDIMNGTGSSGGGGGDAIPQGIHVSIERFTKLKPLAFRSAATPVEAEDWITHMEKLFQVLGCPDNFKTRLAAFKLEGDALSWWKAHLRTQQRYEREYGSICQLDRENSGEYMERLRLPPITSSYYIRAEIQISGIKMVIRFRTGDRANRRTRVVMTRGQDQRFTSRNGNDRQGQGNYNQRQHRGQSTRDFNQGHASGSASQRRSTETLPPPPLCTTCGKPHPGVCYKATGGCFTCGSTQHKVKDCPQAKQKQSMPADFARLPPATGRVYATTRDQAAKTSGTITGNLYIDDRTVFVLFDTGATHSIISTTFAKNLNMNPTPLIERVIISTPMKNHMLIDHEYVNCPLRFDDRIRPANLLPIHMLDFDVILGMDWLASHRATIA
ncbi:reverse transcriptase domain-containing protein [Tanacetum coccineum]